MINWFVKVAPIRQKMLIIVLIGTALSVIASVVPRLGEAYDGRHFAFWLNVSIATATFFIGMGMRRAICDPYVKTVERMEALAAGDLSSPIGFTDYKDCIGRLARGMVTFRDAAALEIERSKERSTVVTILDTHLTDLSRRNEINAGSLEETATAITQMDARLKATAQAASRTVERADQTIATVCDGRAVADEAVQAMGRVLTSAKGTDSVIEGLDKIAFRTRVLAMNAAVEAGRAGEAGRGFATVADLVSALAMRAEEEAKLARNQLTSTQADIVTAVQAVQKVDGALADISGDVAQVHDLLETMAADNQAQSAAITQISAAIVTMDLATRQNAAMVEETSAAARNLAAEVNAATTRVNVGTRALPDVARPRAVDAWVHAASVKPLPAAGIAALVRAKEDWAAF